MKSDFTFYERREYIRSLLLKNKHVTMEKLSFLFGVNKKTIKRDIDFLGSRLPLAIKPGVGGGVFLQGNVESRKEFLTTKEAELLNELSKLLSDDKKLIMDGIIYKFSI